MSNDLKSDWLRSTPMLMAIVAAIAGVVWYSPRVTSSRPVDSSGNISASYAITRVHARLWEDPLRAVQAADAASRDKTQTAFADVLADTIGPLPTAVRLHVVPVFVHQGPYAHDAEMRRRTRVAVVSALLHASYAPIYTEHIGVASIDTGLANLPAASPWLTSIREWLKRDSPKRVHPPLSNTSDAEAKRLIAYEWFIPNNPTTRTHVLILWLPKNLLDHNPLAHLKALIDRIERMARQSARNGLDTEWSIIGPADTTGLRALIRETVDQKVKDNTRVKAIKVLAAMPTASAKELFHPRRPPTDESNYWEERGLDVRRFIIPDDQVLRSIVAELSLRGIDASRDNLAILSESDTAYGRALPSTFMDAAFDGRRREARQSSNIHMFKYLRGIDGITAADSRDSKKTDQSSSGQKAGGGAPSVSEPPEGNNQADYLRRVAEELLYKHEQLLKETGEGLKAIGVLGSDVYDKLMILRALRPWLPGVVFFTNNLDTRLAHETELDATQNLVVGSSYGLSLNDRLQGRTPPFRDSYQTAVYLTSLAALDFSGAVLNTWDSPRVYEISRHGPYDLSPPAGDKEAIIHAPNREHYSWFTFGRVLNMVLAVGIGIALILAAPRFAAPKCPDPAGAVSRRTDRMLKRCDQFLTSTPACVTIGGVAAAVLVGFVYLAQRYDGEPYSWVSGISIWPTVTIRLFAAILAVHFIVKMTSNTLENHRRIESDFMLPPLKDRTMSPLATLWQGFVEAARSFFGWFKSVQVKSIAAWITDILLPSSPPVERGRKLAVVGLWRNFIRRSRIGTRLKRIVVPTTLYLILGMLVIEMTGWPNVPYRGDVSYYADRVAMMLTVVLVILVTFSVLDETLLSIWLIKCLVHNQQEKLWPEPLLKQYGAQVNSGRRSRTAPILTNAIGEYLCLRIIAERTTITDRSIYFPFILLALIVASRQSWFDNWDWPLGLMLVLCAMVCFSGYCVLVLRASANRAKQTVIDSLNQASLRLTAIGRQGGDTIAKLREEVMAIRSGAFAPLREHPILGAVLIPSSGIGVLALIQNMIS